MSPFLNHLSQWRKKHLLLADAMLAWTAIGTVILFLWLQGASLSEQFSVLDGNRASAYGAIASICGSLLGFILTAVSVIAAFVQMPRFSILKQSGQYRYLFTVYFNTIWCLAAGTVLSLTGLIFDKDASPVVVITILNLFTLALVSIRLWRCIRLMSKMTLIAATPLGETQPSDKI